MFDNQEKLSEQDRKVVQHIIDYMIGKKHEHYKRP